MKSLFRGCIDHGSCSARRLWCKLILSYFEWKIWSCCSLTCIVSHLVPVILGSPVWMETPVRQSFQLLILMCHCSVGEFRLYTLNVGYLRFSIERFPTKAIPVELIFSNQTILQIWDIQTVFQLIRVCCAITIP